MIKVNYENPQGNKLHNDLYNGGYAKGTLKLLKKQGSSYEGYKTLYGYLGGCEYGSY